MTTEDFKNWMTDNGLDPKSAAKYLGVDSRSVYRYLEGSKISPTIVLIVRYYQLMKKLGRKPFTG